MSYPSGTSEFSVMSSVVRQSIRKLGVGRALQQIKSLKRTGLIASFQTLRNKRTLLPLIIGARPIYFDPNGVHVHMLLHKKRFLDGLWAIYSFSYFSKGQVYFTLHNDGSLDNDCIEAVKRLFPNIKVIQREEADHVVEAALLQQRALECMKLRRRLVLGRKIIDFLIMSESNSFVVLDYDLLTYAEPIRPYIPYLGRKW